MTDDCYIALIDLRLSLVKSRSSSSILTLQLPAQDEPDSVRSRASNSVAVADDLFKEMTDNALQGIMIHRSHETFYVNHAWASLHGMTVEEVMALPSLLDLIHESDTKRLRGYAADRLAGGHPPVRYRYRALHKSGRTIWLEQFVRMIDWRGERFLQSTVIDVDDQERTAGELRRRQAMMEQEVRQGTEALIRSEDQLYIYQSIIDQMSERISVIGTDYRFRMTNQANANFRRRSRQELIGVHIHETAGDAWFQEHVKGMLDRTFAGQTERHNRKTNSPTGERLHVSVTSEPFRGPDGAITGAIVSIRDITAAKEAEDKLRLFASVVEQVSDRISVISTSYRYRLTNKANLDYHKKPIKAFLNRHVMDIVGEDDFKTHSRHELDRCFAGETVRVRRPGTDGDGRKHMLDILLEPYREPNDRITGAAVTIRDVTEAQHLSERLAYQARHDQLTGLVNRQAFEQCLEAAIINTAGNSRSSALCFIDLDQFKIVNDTVGHLVGDKLLLQVAKLLASKIGKGDVLARLGGDEFGLLLTGCSLRRATRAAEQLIATLNAFQFMHADMMFEVGASIGITAINRHAQCVSDVMAQADLACYAAKDKGRNQVQIYEKRDQFIRQRREEMYRTGGIRTALDKGRFMLFAQPIKAISDTSNDIARVEVLLRMLGECGRLIMPSAFIPAAERYGFMAEVDRWVIRETIDYLARSPEGVDGKAVNINLSGVTLSDETSLDFIRQVLTSSSISPGRISFEITETAAVRNVLKTQDFMQELRDWGCSFALDDFGSGVSSLNYLKRLPVDYLKIDGSFIRDIAKDRGSRVMVEAIQSMANGLGVQTVAEGVENQSTLNALRDLGIDHVQGFAIGLPTPLNVGNVADQGSASQD
ncbi:MAG: EAL domain-containing protein [Pseudomonadota bacterium]